jgi:hypothetical protein
VVRREMAVRVVSLGKSAVMLAMVSKFRGLVVRGATCCLCRSFVLCQVLAGTRATQRACNVSVDAMVKSVGHLEFR